jgi:hypothetical protein
MSSKRVGTRQIITGGNPCKHPPERVIKSSFNGYVCTACYNKVDYEQTRHNSKLA